MIAGGTHRAMKRCMLEFPEIASLEMAEVVERNAQRKHRLAHHQRFVRVRPHALGLRGSLRGTNAYALQETTCLAQSPMTLCAW